MVVLAEKFPGDVRLGVPMYRPPEPQAIIDAFQVWSVPGGTAPTERVVPATPVRVFPERSADHEVPAGRPVSVNETWIPFPRYRRDTTTVVFEVNPPLGPKKKKFPCQLHRVCVVPFQPAQVVWVHATQTWSPATTIEACSPGGISLYQVPPFS